MFLLDLARLLLAFETVVCPHEHCLQVKVVVLTACDDDACVYGLVAGVPAQR